MIQIVQREYAEALYKQLKLLGITGSERAADGAVREAVLNTVNYLVPQNPYLNSSSNHIDKNLTIATSSRPGPALFAIKKNFSHTKPGLIAINFIGEDHSLLADKQRAEEILLDIIQDDSGPYMIIFERGMNYPVGSLPLSPVREENITTVPGINFGFSLSPAQRSLVIAGYITACLASGCQTDNDKVLIFYGERHHDILNSIEYFSKNLMGQALLNRSREYLLVRSQNSAGFTQGYCI